MMMQCPAKICPSISAVRDVGFFGWSNRLQDREPGLKEPM